MSSQLARLLPQSAHLNVVARVNQSLVLRRYQRPFAGYRLWRRLRVRSTSIEFCPRVLRQSFSDWKFVCVFLILYFNVCALKPFCGFLKFGQGVAARVTLETIL